MPYPRNVETAIAVQQTILERGATPATTAVIGGKMRVGLTDDDLDMLGQAGDDAVKVSRRDLAFALARKSVGGTTVATTMMLAASAGIKVFATGGIGGVHRGADTTFDISADLQELAHTPVVVVCAGPKSILDLGLTVEYLETHGVPVVGFGTSTLPAFYTRESDFGVDYMVDHAEEVAVVMKMRRDLSMKGGMLVTNPIPKQFEMPREVIDDAIAVAVQDCDDQGISGKRISPFLLGRIVELTEGASLQANVALVENNARVASDIAIAAASMR
jgi:pseudouridine-5'-phosphate glycosidase